MSTALAVALGIFLVVVGMSHFVVPGYYAALVPPWMPGTRRWVFASGAIEIVIGVGLLTDATRLPAAWAATALMAVYVLTHVDALVRSSPDHAAWLDRPSGAVARVTVNAGYLAWAATVAATA